MSFSGGRLLKKWFMDKAIFIKWLYLITAIFWNVYLFIWLTSNLIYCTSNSISFLAAHTNNAKFLATAIDRCKKSMHAAYLEHHSFDFFIKFFTCMGNSKFWYSIDKSTSGTVVHIYNATYTIMNGKSMSIGHSFNSIRCRCPKGKPKVMIYLLGAQVICHMSSHNFFVWFCTYLWGWLFMRQAIN